MTTVRIVPDVSVLGRIEGCMWIEGRREERLDWAGVGVLTFDITRRHALAGGTHPRGT